MKRILLSAGMIAVVGALAIGGTIAFYNDTETSTGNIFVAGSVDLKVDHLAQTYNGIDCETCSVEVYSSTATQVVAASVGASEQGPFPIPADDVSSPHPAWQNEAALAPAQWIWATDPTTVADTTNGAEYTFENKFQWNGSVVSVDLDLALAADNGYKIILNGTTIVDKLALEFNYNPAVSLSGAEEAAFMAAMVTGQNMLDIVVRNKPLAANPVTGNPAGLLFKLNIQRENCEADSAFQQACMLWQSQDLTGDEQFFNFGDIKPADEGTNLISLHVTSNDAFVCLIPDNVIDDENVVVDPEIPAGDDNQVGIPNGELSDQIEFFGWDDDSDGVYEDGEEVLIPAGTSLNDIQTEMIEMSLSTSGTGYIGLAWCAGTQTGPQVTGEDVALDCDGDGMTNIVQTDKATADLVAYAVQQRNNEDFDCEAVDLENL